MAVADRAVADQLAAGVPQLVLGTNLFLGRLRDGAGMPHLAVACLLYGGTASAYVDGGARTEVARPKVQVTVRSAPESFEAGQELARSCRGAIHFRPPAGYVEAVTAEAEPTYIGTDEAGRHLWTLNVELMLKR